MPLIMGKCLDLSTAQILQMAAAEEKGLTIDYEQAREIIYGMPYSEWKDKYQLPASKEQLQAMAERQS